VSDDQTAARVGCAFCAHAAAAQRARQRELWRCWRADIDPTLRRYPLPVRVPRVRTGRAGDTRGARELTPSLARSRAKLRISSVQRSGSGVEHGEERLEEAVGEPQTMAIRLADQMPETNSPAPCTLRARSARVDGSQNASCTRC
jgi:hypothetical protein